MSDRDGRTDVISKRMFLLVKASSGLRATAAALILVLLAAGIPSCSGVLIRGDKPALTMDICHLPPSPDNSSTTWLSAPLPSRRSATVLAETPLAPEHFLKIHSALAQA